MTFSQAIEAGLAYNLRSTTAKLEVHRAQGIRREIMGQALPTLTATGIYSHIDHARELGGRQLQPQAQLNGNIILTLPVVAPRAWGNVVEARAQERLAQAQHAAARRDVAISVAYAYLDAIAQSQAFEVIQSSVALNRGHYQYAKTRFDGGVGNRLDMLRADQELSTSRVHCRAAQVAALTAQEVLGRLVGYNGAIEPVDEVFIPEALSSTDVMATLEKRRADLRVLLDQMLFHARVHQDSWLDVLPSLLATGQIFGQNPPSPTVPHFGWQVQLMLSVPLYDGGARYGRMAQRHALEAEATLALDDGSRRARSEVRVALAAAHAAEQALVDAERARAQAALALQLATASYRKGLSQNLEVIDAERQARDSATQAVLAHNTLRRAQVDLVAAAGQFPGPL
jgi:outer membrane protein TolC